MVRGVVAVQLEEADSTVANCNGVGDRRRASMEGVPRGVGRASMELACFRPYVPPAAEEAPVADGSTGANDSTAPALDAQGSSLAAGGGARPGFAALAGAAVRGNLLRVSPQGLPTEAPKAKPPSPDGTEPEGKDRLIAWLFEAPPKDKKALEGERDDTAKGRPGGGGGQRVWGW